MADIKIGDRVYVKTQPHNQWVRLQGERAFVVGISDDGQWIDIETREGSKVTGMGSVPPNCLTAIVPIDSESNVGDYVDVQGHTCKVLYKFPVLWHSWECDSEGWVVDDAGQSRLVLTNHGSAHFADEETLKERMLYYHAVLLKSAEALELIR